MPLLRFLLLLCVFSLHSMHALQAQQIAPLGRWTSYLSHYEVTEITNRFDRIYAITPGGIFYYDEISNEVKATTKVEGLSGVNPTTLYYAPQSDYVFVGFPDGMINFFREPERLEFITDIQRSELFTSRIINQFFEHGGYLYIATEFGIVVFDIAAMETKFSVTKIANNNTGTPVHDLVIANDSIWATVGNLGVYAAALNEPNLTVPTVWQQVSGTAGLPLAYTKKLASVADTVYALIEDSVFVKEPGQLWAQSGFYQATYVSLSSNEGHVFGTHEGACEVRTPGGGFYNVINGGTQLSAWVHNGTTYIGDRYAGLLKPATPEFIRLSPAGPSNNFVADIAMGEREFYIAPRGRKGPSDRWGDVSGVYYHSLTEGWKILDRLSENLSESQPHKDFARTYYDRATRTAWMGSWGDGLLVLRDGDTLNEFPNKFSPISIETQGDSLARVSGIDMDRNGNIWISLALSDYKLNMITPEGNWFYFSGINNSVPVGLVVDDFNNKWVINNQAGLTVFNENGTPGNANDDLVVNLTANSGAGGLPNNTVFSLVKDLDGQIWVGTSEGATVFYDPASAFSSNFPDAACPIIEGYCLLKDQKVNTIAVDGANRKWMGTDNGIYVISDDGTEEILHFTTDNSPLIDNVIVDIAIDPSTGEVLIGTQSGLISYMGDATEGEETSDSLLAFPNPVEVDYNGQITIRGSVTESRVKITTVTGALVRELSSLGGETTWDLKDAWGNTVTPGIYLVMLADKQGSGPGITKIAVLERNMIR